MNILITGGCGYVGTELIKTLLLKKHKITNIDLAWYGNHIKKNKLHTFINDDFRNLNHNFLNKFDTIIHLANVANDPSAELNPSLSWEINTLGMQVLCEKLIKSKLKKIIYASSGSVYGVKKEKQVTEKLDLNPISIYNKTKMTAERILLSYKDFLNPYILRPATVCGYSDRMRLDLTVNILTYSALSKREISVFGGSQFRPNINIKDMIRVYEHFLEKKINTGIYNCGFENKTVMQVAKFIKSKIPCNISIKQSNDNRSYRLNSDKLLSTGFRPMFDVNDAIEDIISIYKDKKLIKKPEMMNISWLKKKNK